MNATQERAQSVQEASPYVIVRRWKSEGPAQLLELLKERETRAKLQSILNELQRKCADLERENQVLRDQAGVAEDDLCLLEEYVGMVTHADAAQVEVTFNLKNGSFRQVFRPDQMVEGVALRTGDLVTAFCAAYIREQSIPASEVSLETTEIREFANFKHGLSGVIRL